MNRFRRIDAVALALELPKSFAGYAINASIEAATLALKQYRCRGASLKTIKDLGVTTPLG